MNRSVRILAVAEVAINSLYARRFSESKPSSAPAGENTQYHGQRHENGRNDAHLRDHAVKRKWLGAIQLGDSISDYDHKK